LSFGADYTAVITIDTIIIITIIDNPKLDHLQFSYQFDDIFCSCCILQNKTKKSDDIWIVILMFNFTILLFSCDTILLLLMQQHFGGSFTI